MKTYLKDLTPDEVITRLKAGEVVRYDNVTATSKLIEGFLCDVFPSGDYRIGSYITARSYPSPYFETPDELKLEVGKCYKTRSGKKAFICHKVNESDCFVGTVAGERNNGFLQEWDSHGNKDMDENNLDLVSEWSDDDVAED